MSMSRENIHTTKQESQDGQSTATQKKILEQGLRCPRCDSANTKFCYYNNYNLSQPRHFCKTCRRYWTKGGALRNVPIGGGCRKNKKTRSSLRSSGNINSYNLCESSLELGGFKLFQGISPTMDFQLGGVSNFPKAYNHHLPSYNLITSNTNSSFGLETLGGSVPSPVMGFGFPLPNVINHGESSGYGLEQHEHQMGISMNVQSNFASSIESLSSINQELHWKLQQERLGMFSGVHKNNQNENSNLSLPMEGTDAEKSQPFMFQDQQISKKDTFGLDEVRKGGGDEDITTEWLFETSYASTSNRNPTNSSSNGNEGTSNWSNNRGWSKLNHYGAIP